MRVAAQDTQGSREVAPERSVPQRRGNVRHKRFQKALRDIHGLRVLPLSEGCSIRASSARMACASLDPMPSTRSSRSATARSFLIVVMFSRRSTYQALGGRRRSLIGPRQFPCSSRRAIAELPTCPVWAFGVSARDFSRRAGAPGIPTELGHARSSEAGSSLFSLPATAWATTKYRALSSGRA